MKTNQEVSPDVVTNILPLPARLGRIAHVPASVAVRQRFRILPFLNASGTKSFRVQGMKRDGVYVRQNFADLRAAEARRLELEQEHLISEASEPMEIPRLTLLSADELRLAELGFKRLAKAEADKGDLLDAIQAWLKGGRKRALSESPRLDDALEQFTTWLESTPTLRERTKSNLRLRVAIFANSTGNVRLDAITPELIEAFLANRKVSPMSRDNDRRALCRFFAWCKERPRYWLTFNPAREVRVERGESAPPAVLTFCECERLLRAAEAYRAGQLVPYLVVCLFAGLRPSEAARLEWEQINLDDGEIRLEARQTKTGRPRVIAFNDGPPEQKPFNTALAAWLRAYKNRPVHPPKWSKNFQKVKRAAGFGTPTPKNPDLKPWPGDVLRHAAISFFFRLTGSYGRTAEVFGNTEAVIKAHYQGRVSSPDTRRFYTILPTAKKSDL